MQLEGQAATCSFYCPRLNALRARAWAPGGRKVAGCAAVTFHGPFAGGALAPRHYCIRDLREGMVVCETSMVLARDAGLLQRRAHSFGRYTGMRMHVASAAVHDQIAMRFFSACLLHVGALPPAPDHSMTSHA